MRSIEGKDNIFERNLSHLEEPYKPIMAALHNGKLLDAEEANLRNFNADDVNWHDRFVAQKSGCEMTAAGVVSSVNTANKRSSAYDNCMGLVLVGRSVEDEQNISLLIHATPREIASPAEEFLDLLGKKLVELKQWSCERSVDALYFGGAELAGERGQEYEVAADVLKNVVDEHFDFKPVAVVQPKSRYVPKDPYEAAYMPGLPLTDVLLDTKNRRLHIFQSNYDADNNTQFNVPGSQ